MPPHPRLPACGSPLPARGERWGARGHPHFFGRSAQTREIPRPCGTAERLRGLDKHDNLLAARRVAGYPISGPRDPNAMPRIALFTGTFDPVTNGHLDVVR